MSQKQKKALGKRIALYLATGLLSCNLTYANPSDHSIVAGNATFDSSTANVLNITGVTNGTVINWGSFSIPTGDTTSFSGATNGYAVLNRVVGSDPSAIYGNLIADNAGQVFLVNQNGIVIGGGAVINTGQFVASTINITDANFAAYAGGGKLIFDQAHNQANVNGGNSGAVALANGNIAAAGEVSLLGGTVSVAPGVTFTVTDGRLSLLAVQSLTYDPANTKDGMSYTATSANTVVIGDGTSNKGINLTANDITLSGGKVMIAGPTDSTTGKKIKINAGGDLDIYALNAKTESFAAADGVTTYTSQYNADKNNEVTISGNVKLNDTDGSGTAVSGEKVNITGGAIGISGIDTDNKAVINNTRYGVNIRAIKAATLTSNTVDSTGTTNLTADADSKVTLNHAKIIAGTDMSATKSPQINLQGGAISLADTRLEADGAQWDGVSLNAFTDFDKTTAATGDNSTTFTMANDKSSTVAITDSAIVTPEITITGSSIAIKGSALTASDFMRMYAADKLVRAKNGADRTEALTATAANTLSLTDSSIRMNPFSDLWSIDKSAYNDTRTDASSYNDSRKDVQLVGGKVTLTGYQTITEGSETKTPGVIFDASKNTDILIAAGNNVQYAYSNHALDASAVTSYSGAADNSVAVDMAAGAAATLNADALITGQDVSIIGGAVTVTGQEGKLTIQATQTNTGTGNVGIYAVKALSNTSDTLSLTATKDNAVVLGSSSAPVTVSAGADILIIGGTVSVTGVSDSSQTGLAAVSDITVRAVNSLTKKSVNFETTAEATPDNALKVSYAKMSLAAGGNSEHGILLQGGKVDIDHAALHIAHAIMDLNNGTLPGYENPKSVTIGAFTHAGSDWKETPGLSTGTWSMTTNAGNTVKVANSTVESPDVGVYGSTIKLDNVTVTAGDYIGLYAVKTMDSTEEETPLILNDPDKETLKLTATAANTLEIADSTLAINSVKATPYEAIQTDIQLSGGAVSLTGATLNTNNTTDVLITAGNKVEYAHELHGLAVNNITRYEGDSANTVTLGSAAKPTTIAATDVTIIGGAVMVTGQEGKLTNIQGTEAVNGTGNVGIYAVKSLSNSTADGLQAEAANKVTLQNAKLQTTTVHNTGSDIVIAGGSIAIDDSALISPSGLELYAVSKVTAHDDVNDTYIPVATEFDKGTITAQTVSGNTITVTNSTLTGDVVLIGAAITATGSTLQKSDEEDNIQLYAAQSLTDVFGGASDALSLTATKDNTVVLNSAVLTAGKDITVIGGKVEQNQATLNGTTVIVVEKAPTTTPTDPTTPTNPEIPTSPSQLQENPNSKPVVQVNQTVASTVITPSTDGAAGSTGTSGMQGSGQAGGSLGGGFTPAIGGTLGGIPGGSAGAGGPLISSGGSTAIAPGVTVTGGEAAASQQPLAPQTPTGQTQEPGGASGSQSQEQREF